MYIVYHHRTLLHDAQGIHVGAIVRAFRELGHEVQVISLVDSPSGRAARALNRPWQIDPGGMPRVVYEALSLGYNLYGYRQLARTIRERKPDLIYERYAPNTFCGVLASRRLGVPLLLEINAPWKEHWPSGQPPRLQRLARRVERWVCSNSSHTIAVTAALTQLLLEAGVPERQVTVMHNAVDPAIFDPGVSGAEVRRRYRLNGHVVAGFVGWLRQWHGLEDLIGALHASDLFARGLRLLIVGSGPSLPQVQQRVGQLGLEDKVILTGAVAHDQVPAHIAALDIALQPRATAFACPMKLVEYMAMGRCILAPDQPNIRELLRDGVTARLFPPAHDQSLVHLLSELMDLPAQRAALGRKARQSVLRRNLVWRANAARALDLLCGEHHARADRPIAEVEAANG